MYERVYILFQGFYEEVSSPLLLNVDLQYPDNTVDSVTTNHFSQLFNGSEIVVAGRLMDNDLDSFLVEVLGQGVRKRKKYLRYSSQLLRCPFNLLFCCILFYFFSSCFIYSVV